MRRTGAVGGLVVISILVVAAAAAAAVAEEPGSAGGELAERITAILHEQADAWNRGDIDAFMEYYWRSDELTFSSGGKTTRGWQATKDGYKRRYPTRAAMGTLTFSQLEITPIGDAGALVLGNWRLERDEPAGGNFTLVLRKIDGRWRIVHDHTSRSETEQPAARASKPAGRSP